MQDYNLGLEVVKCYEKYFDHQEKRLHGFIDQLARANTEIKIVSDVVNKLSHVKQKGGTIDINSDPALKRCILHIHKNNPTIFDDLIKNFPEQTPTPPRELTGEEITFDNVLKRNLTGIDQRSITIEPLTEEQIEIVLQGLDGALKGYTADLNEQMLKINENYDNRSQMTEQARQVVKQSGDLLESINRKMVSR